MKDRNDYGFPQKEIQYNFQFEIIDKPNNKTLRLFGWTLIFTSVVLLAYLFTA